ncbi:HHL1-like protein [Almyronema epifaneia]|uniref:HHL1-like protein n=1 Tax=Almyronema epifaneia S1 TaxID=2991925 RepID=A0ABW6IJ47_9CYAN
MSTKLGFGSSKPQRRPSKGAAQRAKASQQYDRLKADGTPDFEIYIRIRGKQSWYPVGAIAAKRSSLINRAIFNSQSDLLQGAFRLYPVLRKHKDQLEYGYRLKEFKDEPIQLATAPGAGVSGAIAQLGQQMTAWFKR